MLAAPKWCWQHAGLAKVVLAACWPRQSGAGGMLAAPPRLAPPCRRAWRQMPCLGHHRHVIAARWRLQPWLAPRRQWRSGPAAGAC
jgi:hypothetical protein